MTRLGRFLLLAAFSATVLAADGNTTASDANTQPIGGYVPKKAPAVIALILYAISGAVHWFHFVTATPRQRFLLILPLGMTAMAIGFVLRLIYSNPPFTIGKYTIMTLFILLSPCLFLATDYVLLSHLARTFDAEIADRCLLIRDSRITKIFVWSDVSTFLLQSGGSGISASHNPSTAKLGTDIALVGLILQAVSFGLFTIILLVFAFRVQKHFPDAWRPKNPRPFKILSREPIDDWRILFYMMCVTCVGILIRSIFRVAEFAQGYSGYITTHEGFFYIFDTVPLWIAMTLYCVVWPTRALVERPGHMELTTKSFLPAAPRTHGP
ncbi:RTA1 like protein-domain-containing protein [Mycena alexandri]|uniref:RTA1 like protein-domain-containing protein n=1 Tax=Mycena alexandri TaxID=1745969 RepID=A0AAD6T1I7_9AGAR|nr:RTA1 like protein-domain-containing protein [Mycena alexandri]